MEKIYQKKESARHGVEIDFPEELIEQVEINQVKEVDLTNDRGRASGIFNPHRIVANINAPQIKNLPNEGKVRLRVYLNSTDYSHNPSPTLAYWKNEQWNLFDSLVDYIHRFPLPDNLIWVGYIEIQFHDHDTFNTFGDPPIAVG